MWAPLEGIGREGGDEVKKSTSAISRHGRASILEKLIFAFAFFVE
jgi:hypothetical protein